MYCFITWHANTDFKFALTKKEKSHLKDIQDDGIPVVGVRLWTFQEISTLLMILLIVGGAGASQNISGFFVALRKVLTDPVQKLGNYCTT